MSLVDQQIIPIKRHIHMLSFSKILSIKKKLVRRRKKNPCSTGEEIPKNGRSVQIFFFFNFYILLPKLPEKSLKIFFFSCSLRSNFCPKNSWFYNFFCLKKKKKSANWEKAVGRARRTGFFFLGLIHKFKHVVFNAILENLNDIKTVGLI